MEESKRQFEELQTIPEEERSQMVITDVSEAKLNEKLVELKKQAKNGQGITQDLENNFVDLLKIATEFYQDEMNYELAKFYYAYGSILLDKLESNTDIFGDLMQKKEQNNEDQEEVQPQKGQQQQQKVNNENKMQVEEQEQQQQKQAAVVEEEIQPQKGEQQQQKKVVFQDENVTIQDEQQEDNCEDQEIEQQKNQEQSKNNNNNEKEEEKEDDLQILYENLYTALRIAEKDEEHMRSTYSPEQIRENVDFVNKVMFLSDICTKLAEYENWREKFNDSLEYLQKARNYMATVKDEKTSRDIAELEFMLGTTQLYKEDGNELISLQHFTNSIKAIEDILSGLSKLPLKVFPSDMKNLTKDHISTEHLKENFLDTQEQREIKSILLSLYNKLEDTILQRDQKSQFQAEQQRAKALKEQKEEGFKPAVNKGPVKNLGVVGNAKKRNPVQNNPNQVLVFGNNNNSSQLQQQQQENNNNNKENNSNNNKQLLTTASQELQQQQKNKQEGEGEENKQQQ